MIKKCLVCEKEFKTPRHYAKYCSQKCMGLTLRRSRKKFTCKFCHKVTELQYRRSGTPVYCSKSCKSSDESVCGTNSGISKKLSEVQQWILKKDIADYMISFTGDNYHHPTKDDILYEFKVSSKTLTKIGFKLADIINEHSLGRAYPSKFQTKVRHILYKVYGKDNVTEECKFDDLVSGRTGYKLRFDFYIENENLLIECDGTQHVEVGNKFYSKNMVDNDITKDEYALKNSIDLVRIPYKNRITTDYVLNLISWVS